MEYHGFKADVWKTVLFPYILWEKLVDYAYIFYNVYNKMEGSEEWQNSFRLKKKTCGLKRKASKTYLKLDGWTIGLELFSAISRPLKFKGLKMDLKA